MVFLRMRACSRRSHVVVNLYMYYASRKCNKWWCYCAFTCHSRPIMPYQCLCGLQSEALGPRTTVRVFCWCEFEVLARAFTTQPHRAIGFVNKKCNTPGLTRGGRSHDERFSLLTDHAAENSAEFRESGGYPSPSAADGHPTRSCGRLVLVRQRESSVASMTCTCAHGARTYTSHS